MRAYIVQDKCNEWAEVVFAKNNIGARRPYEGYCITCYRAPQYDAYAAQGFVPVIRKLDDGWWLECYECQRKVDLSELSDEEITLHLVTDMDRRLFCHAECRGNYRRKQQNLDIVKKRFKALYPSAEVMYVYQLGTSHGGKIGVKFIFEDGRYKGTYYEGGEVWVSKLNLSAFTKFREREQQKMT